MKKKNYKKAKKIIPPNFRWPERVHVLTMNDLKGGGDLPGMDWDNYPRCPQLWMQYEIRCLRTPIRDISLFIDIWIDLFVAIKAELQRRKMRYSLCDHYNAVWAYLGYTNNQCSRAIKIASFISHIEIEHQPNDKHFDDPIEKPRPISIKKLHIRTKRKG